MATSSGKSQIVPKSWPQQARDLYDPIRRLGIGGFGAVWLAKRSGSGGGGEGEGRDDKHTDTTASNNSENAYVAIKLVGHPLTSAVSSFEKMSEEGYFRREVEVLQEISHPRIVKLIHKIEGEETEGTAAAAAAANDESEKAVVVNSTSAQAQAQASPYCMVLEFCRGPTLEQMLAHGGGLGLPMAREISAQLIDAVSYLHGRGVIHRDIKPDNIVIAGAKPSDEACWSDDTDGEDAARALQWNMKLIDFGFARPLHPDDIKDHNKVLTLEVEPDDAFFGSSTIDRALEDKDKNDSLSLSTSVSHAKVIDLSAVGNRNYAAPEVLKLRNAKKNKGKAASGKKDTHAQALSECVSDYGLIADAYSVGKTIRYMLTGVPPEQSVNDFLAEKNSFMNVLGRKLKKKMAKDKEKIRKRKYRRTSDLPKEASKVVLGLTHWNERSRTTIRSARNFEWIKQSYTMKSEKGRVESVANEHHGKIEFLKCALERKV